MNENQLTHKIIGCAIEVHRCLGPGLLESVYEEALCYEFTDNGICFERQSWVPVEYHSRRLATQLRIDLVVENLVIVENKSCAAVNNLDRKQLLTYLRFRELQVGLLINFNVPRLTDGLHRVVNNFVEE